MNVSAPQRRLTKVGFGRHRSSRSNRRGEWVVVEATLLFGEETGDFEEVFIGSHREAMDFRDDHDTYGNLELVKIGD